MPNPFSSDYISATVTRTVTVPASPAPKIGAAQTPITLFGEGTKAKIYGFEPERYGLGKPRRIVVRGKIARE